MADNGDVCDTIVVVKTERLSSDKALLDDVAANQVNFAGCCKSYGWTPVNFIDTLKRQLSSVIIFLRLSGPHVARQSSPDYFSRYMQTCPYALFVLSHSQWLCSRTV